MRNISFMLTTDQVRAGTKTVTRRIGWAFLKPGDRLMACVKCQGLGKGGKIEKIRPIEVVKVELEKLSEIILRPVRDGFIETAREGFPDMTDQEFLEMFCRHMGCCSEDEVTRIEFKYLPHEKSDREAAGRKLYALMELELMMGEARP